MKRTKWFWIAGAALTWLTVVVLAIVLLGAWLWRQWQSPGKPLVSKETTRITGPLDAEGYVDYVEALNQRYAKGVTPANNAAVPLLQALGPGPADSPIQQEHFQRLGLSVPAEGDQFVDLRHFVRQRKADLEAVPAYAGKPSDEQIQIATVQQGKAMDDPWSTDRYPLIAAWIEANERPLAMVVEGLSRERFYVPLVAPETGARLMCTLLPVDQATRDVARALTARAMLRLERGEVRQAQRDALAVHRLGRLVGRGPILIDGLVGISMDRMAVHLDGAIMAHETLTVEQTRAYMAALRQLPPLPDVVETVDVGERYVYLDSVTAMARWGAAAVDDVIGEDSTSGIAEDDLLVGLGRAAIDWSMLLRMGNEHYNRLVASLSRPTHRERMEGFEELRQQIKQRTDDARDPRNLLKDILSAGPRGAVSDKIGTVMVALVVPPVNVCLEAIERSVATERLVVAALALEGYRAEHAGYPDELAGLVPAYLDEVPVDPFADAPLRYARKDEGYLIYSVGPNMQDDGGRNEQDDIVYRPPGERLPEGERTYSENPEDDIVIRMKR